MYYGCTAVLEVLSVRLRENSQEISVHRSRDGRRSAYTTGAKAGSNTRIHTPVVSDPDGKGGNWTHTAPQRPLCQLPDSQQREICRVENILDPHWRGLSAKNANHSRQLAGQKALVGVAGRKREALWPSACLGGLTTFWNVKAWVDHFLHNCQVLSGRGRGSDSRHTHLALAGFVR